MASHGRAAALLFALLGLLGPSAALALDAAVTPPQWRGDLGGQWFGSVQAGRLVDRSGDEGPWLDVARGVEQRHGLHIEGWFAPWHGLAVGLEAPIVVHQRRTWERALDMRFDPDAGRATMIGGSPLGEDVLDGSRSSLIRRGFGDLRIALRFVPFAQEGVPGRVAPTTLAFDIGLTVPSGGNAERVRDNGTTGPGTGGAAFDLGISASRRLGTIEPFVHGRLRLTAPYRQALSDASGREVIADDADGEGLALLDPRDEVGLYFGSEIHAIDDRANDRSVRVLLRAGALFRSAGELGSGRLLPAPLEATVGHVALEGQHVAVDLLWGLRARPRGPIEIRVDAGATWSSPHTVERLNDSTYEIRSGGDTFDIRWMVGAFARFR